MTSPPTHPAERETPAGEAIREAVARVLAQTLDVACRIPPDCCPGGLEGVADAVDALCSPSGPIASELARLTAERDAALHRCPIGLDESPGICSAGTCYVCISDRCRWAMDELDAAEAALTSHRAEHAAEVARLTFALAASPKYQKALDHCVERCSLPCIACQRLEGIRESAFIRRAALAPKETTDA